MIILDKIEKEARLSVLAGTKELSEIIPREELPVVLFV
jgi:hypothetical protein